METFLWAVVSHWVASMSGIVAICVGVIQYLRKTKLAPTVWIFIGSVCLLIASYQAWHDEHAKLIAAQSISPTSLSRKMADDLEARIKAAGPDFVKRLDFIVIAFTCGSGTQQFADDLIQVLSSSGVNASRLIWCKNNTEIETSGLFMTVPNPEHLTDTSKEFLKLIRDSLIPIAPHPIRSSDLEDKPEAIGFIYVGK